MKNFEPAIHSQHHGVGFVAGVNAISGLILPSILVGYSLCRTAGFWNAVAVISLGSFVLYRIALMMINVAVTSELGTMDIIEGYLGKPGEKLCAFVIAGSQFGWFLWQITFCSQFCSQLAIMKGIPPAAVTVTLYLMFWGIALQGEKSIKFIGIVVVPLLIILIVCLVIFFPDCESTFHFGPKIKSFNISSLSLFVNSFSTLMLTTATLFKFSGSAVDARKSVMAVHLFAIPITCGLGVTLGAMSPTIDLFQVFSSSTGNWPALFLAYVLLGGLAICIFDLHYGSDAIAHAFSLRSHIPVLILMGICGSFVVGRTRLGRIGPSELFQVVIAVIVAIVAVRASFSNLAFGRDEKYIQKANFRAMMWASAVGLIAQMGWIEVTGVPSFDAALVAFGLCIYFSRSRRKKARAQLL